MMQTIGQTKKPRCISILRPVPQPEPQQLSSRISRLPPSTTKSSISSDPKSLSPPGSKSLSADPRSLPVVGPKSQSSRSKPSSPRLIPQSPNKGSNSPYSGSKSLSARQRSLISSTGPKRKSSSSSRSPSSNRKPPYSAGSSNPSSPVSRMSPDLFSLFKLPLQIISNILMPPTTVKQNTSSVISPFINFQMPLTFSTVHAAPSQVPCKIITNSPIPCGGNPGSDILTDNYNNPQRDTSCNGNPIIDHSKPYNLSYGILIYNFICDLLFHKQIIITPPQTLPPTTVKIDTTLPPDVTTSFIPPKTSTPIDAPTDPVTDVITDIPTTTVQDINKTTPIVTVTTPCPHDIPTTTKTPIDDIICKFVYCSPVLRYIISKHMICKSSLPFSCHKNKHHFHRRISHHPNKVYVQTDVPEWSHYGDKFNSEFVNDYDEPALNNSQEELLLKLLKILISSSNNRPPASPQVRNN